MNKQGPLILALDTASACCTVAITCGTVEDGDILAQVSLNSRITHSRRLIGTMDWMLAEAEVDWTMIDGVSVGLGPGSFTGLRLGLATAKGLATAAGKPLLGMSTLDAVACNCMTEMPICVAVDARKKQVYVAYYRYRSGRVERTCAIRAVDPAVLIDEIQEPVLMVGDAVPIYGNLWQEGLGEKVAFAPATLHSPTAAAVGLLGAQALVENRILDPATAVPLYVRASDAELNLKQKKEREARGGQ